MWNALASLTLVTPVTLEAGAGGPDAVALGAVATGFLILLLILRELLAAYAEELPASRRRASVEAFAKGLGIGVPPLLGIFGLIVALRVLTALQG